MLLAAVTSRTERKVFARENGPGSRFAPLNLIIVRPVRLANSNVT